MLRASIIPRSHIHERPAFWGFDREFKNVLENLDSVWEGSKASLLNEFNETDKAYFFSLDMPGVNIENVDIEVEDNTLIIKSKRESLFDSSKEFQTNTKKFSLPKDVDKDKIEAKVVDGVLYLALPKLEKAEPRKIKITNKETLDSWSNLLESPKEEVKE